MNIKTTPFQETRFSKTEEAILTFKSRIGQSLTVRTTISGSARITIDGETVDLTDTADEIYTFKRYNARKVRFTTWSGVQIDHEGMIVSLFVPAVYQRSLSGLCGNYDFNKDNDFLKPNGTPRKCGIGHDNGYEIDDCERETACGFQIEGDCGPKEVEVKIDNFHISTERI